MAKYGRNNPENRKVNRHKSLSQDRDLKLKGIEDNDKYKKYMKNLSYYRMAANNDEESFS